MVGRRTDFPGATKQVGALLWRFLFCGRDERFWLCGLERKEKRTQRVKSLSVVLVRLLA